MASSSIVVDASVAVKWLVFEEGSERANALLKTWLKRRTKILAPDFLLIEAHNVLWKKVQRGQIGRDIPIFGSSPTLGLACDWISSITLLPRAAALALRCEVTIYDAIYAALAERVNCPFYTADAQLKERLRPASIAVENL